MQHATNSILTEQELAEFLKISPQTLRHSRCGDKGFIPYVRVGGSIRYRMEDVHKYLEMQVVSYAAS